jgi:hypothetical protein
MYLLYRLGVIGNRAVKVVLKDGRAALTELDRFGRIINAYYDGLRLGLLVKKEVGTLSLYKAPYVRLRFEFLIPDSLRLCRGTGITHRDLVCSELKAN